MAVPAVVVTEKTESLPAGAAPAAGAPSSDVVKKEEGQEATAGAATTVKQENGGGAPATTTTPAPTAAAPPVVQEQPPHDPNRRLYGDAIESVMRNQIQRMKIEMANEVIDAGRFDQQTSMEERRHTLEALLQDQDRALQAVNSVPTNHELNKMLARGEDEMALFEKMDQEPGIWFDCTRPNEVPRWMQWRERDLRAALEENSKHKVDIEAEMAALTGTVLHHHVAPTPEGKAAAGAGAGGTAVKVAAAPEVKAAPAAPAAAAPPRAEPAVTTTTTRSLGREEEEEEDEVGMIDNDEEEEILEQNLVTDEANTEGGGNGNGAGAASGGGGNGGAVSGGNSGLQHIQSTAGMPRIPSVGTAAVPSNGEDSLKRTAAEVNNADGEGDGAAAGEPLTKKRRALSVHFEDVEEGKITQDGAVNVNDAGSILPPPPTTATAPAANPPPANGDDGKQ